MNNNQFVKDFIQSFNDIDYTKMQSMMHDDMVSHVTIADGGTKLLRSSEEYINAIKAMKMAEVNFRIEITQILEIEPSKIMFMIEVHAEKPNKKLHNFAAHLINIKNGKIKEIWMVEALPKNSEEFWLD